MTELIWVDVFATGALSGNQLAVIPDASDLSEEQMQAIARETALSETTFVLPSEQSRCDLRFRIFTPAQELPMAGHPVVGAAWVMARRGALGPTATIETGVGPLAVSVSEIGAEMVQATPEHLGSPDLGPVAASLGVQAASDRPSGVWSTGLPQLMLPVASVPELESAEPNGAELGRLGDEQGWIGVSVYAFAEPEAGARAVVRHFAPGAGVLEDPATGSAAGALGACLYADRQDEGGFALTISQGAGLGRPAEIRVRVAPGPVVTVGGRVRPVLSGALDQDAFA